LEEIGVPRNGFDVVYDYTVCVLTAHSGSLWSFRPFLTTIYLVLLRPEPRPPTEMGSATHRAPCPRTSGQSYLSRVPPP
jgi:hypothetical protein